MTLDQIDAAEWLNAPAGFGPAAQAGKVTMVTVFQMLCPGCVSHSIPQSLSVRRIFPADEVAVLGLHSVFEHHAAMTPVALAAFLHEYRISFPVGIDRPSDPGPLPRTMDRFRLQGTPTLLLFDRAGQLRAHHFGQVHDLVVGAEIATLLGERPTTN